MIANGVMFSVEECNMLLELIGVKYLDDYNEMTPQQLSMITQLRMIVRDNPIGTHIEQYHD